MMELASEFIKLTILENSILQISFNRPEQLNALSHNVLENLYQILQKAKFDSTVKAILITGEGRGFCAGADIKQLADLSSTAGLQFARYGQLVLNLLENLGKPSVAAIHGFALGGGCELAMAATMRIAAEKTVFGQPEINLGVIPGFGGTQRLSRLIGKGRALEICLTGKRFNATDALKWGFLNEVVAPDQLIPTAITLLKTITQFSAIPIQSILDVIQQGYDLSLSEALELEAVHFGLCCTTADKKEGVNAFLEKRVPVFNGV